MHGRVLIIPYMTIELDRHENYNLHYQLLCKSLCINYRDGRHIDNLTY